ncbi:MAG: hypothetical protein KJO77_09320 [Bacteroidia bacterium]|nr:hypothetical protein [Bacteroidia bacterium]
MKTKPKKTKYVEWLSAEVMHKASRKWLSELQFICDEQLFFDDLIKSYTLQLIDSKHFETSKKIVEKLSELQKRNENLINVVKIHENELEIMVDGIDQPNEEEMYKQKHRDMIVLMSEYFNEYRMLKKRLFDLIKKIIKDEKQKRLLN